jgi:hypothetical protein
MKLSHISVARLKQLHILLQKTHLIFPIPEFKEEPPSKVFNIRHLASHPYKLIEMLQAVLSNGLNVRFNNVT